MRQRTAKLLIVLAAMSLFPLAFLSSSEAQTARASASASAAASASSIPGYSADPPPITSENQWLLSLRYDGGRIIVVGARKVRLPQARSTPRNIGRFAAELLSGPAVIERLRFNFPLIGADESVGVTKNYNSPPRFETRAVVVQQIMLPDTSRASRARLLDRATGRFMAIDWPPVADLDAGLVTSASSATPTPADAGVIADSGADIVVEAGADARLSD
jgi:hypothetical protein